MPLDLSVAQALGVPNLDQYFGLWAVEETRFLSMFSHISAMDLRAHIEQARIEPEAAISVNVNRSGAIAVIDIQGTMTKHGSSFSSGGSTIRVRREIRVAAADTDVHGILLRIDSPGGTVAGTADLAADVLAARKAKPVFAFIEDLGASAAYWVASQATKIFVNDATAFVGTIGAFIGLYDLSGLAEKEGIKAIVIKAGEFKGTAFPGTEITSEQQAMLQKLVDKTQNEFNAAIQRGRGMKRKQVEQLADGRVHVAPDAMELGLIDGIQSFDATIKQLAKEPAPQTGRKSKEELPLMDTQTTDPKPATAAELSAKFPDAKAEFKLKCIEEEATIQQASDRYLDQVRAERENRDQEIETLKARNAELQDKIDKPPRGAAPIRADADPNSGGAADPISDVNERVQKLVASGMSKQMAHAKVMADNPELRHEYVIATNLANGRKAGAATYQEAMAS